jgi:hypothetical protein
MSTTKFIQASEALAKANADFKAGKLSSVGFKDLREYYIPEALYQMAALFSIRLKEPLQVDSNGELMIVSVTSCAEVPQRVHFSQAYADILNQHNPRCGVQPGAHILPENSWCRLNHFEAEKMVLNYLATLTAKA